MKVHTCIKIGSYNRGICSNSHDVIQWPVMSVSLENYLCHLGLAGLRLRVLMSLLEIEPERRLELGLETSLWETDLDREDIGLDDGG